MRSSKDVGSISSSLNLCATLTALINHSGLYPQHHGGAGAGSQPNFKLVKTGANKLAGLG